MTEHLKYTKDTELHGHDAEEQYRFYIKNGGAIELIERRVKIDSNDSGHKTDTVHDWQAIRIEDVPRNVRGKFSKRLRKAASQICEIE